MSPSASTANHPHSRITDALFLFGGWVLATTGAAYLIIPSGILPIIQRDLLVGAVSASWLVSAPYAAEAIGGIPTGMVLDRVDARRIVTVAVVIFLGVNVVGAFAGDTGSYGLLLASRFIGGLAYMMLWLATIQLVTNRFTSRTATAVGLHTTSGPTGVAAGLALGPAVASSFSWHSVFWVLSGMIVISYGIFALTTGNDERSTPDAPENSIGALSTAVRNRGLLLVGALAFVAYSLFLLFSSWMPTYLVEEFGLSLEQSSLYVAVFPAVGVVARSAGGIVSDYLPRSNPRLVLRVSFLALLPVVFGMAVMSSIASIFLLMLTGGFFVQSGIGLFFTYGSQLVTESAEGTAVALLSTAGLTGAFTAPVVAGTLVSTSGEFLPVFGYALALCLLGVLATVRLPAAS